MKVYQNSAPASIRILTHNIRYATTSPFSGEELWPVRSPRLCSELLFNSQYPAETFICLQEVLHSQLLDIHAALNATCSSDWAYIGVGRDDGEQAGEYSPIFYRPSVWRLLHWTTVWLSETPNVPSKGWDAASTRIVTVGCFEHIATRWPCIIMSTHLDDQGAKSRAESAKLILKLVQQRFSDLPVFLGGDFNSPPADGAYKIMTSPISVMLDAGVVLPKAKRYGHEMTFTSFGQPGQEPPSKIDFVFLKKACNVTVKSYGVLENKFDDEIYSSDHRAVIVDIEILPDPLKDGVERGRLSYQSGS